MMTCSRSRVSVKIADEVGDSIHTRVDSMIAVIELYLMDYLRDYTAMDFAHSVDYMDDCMQPHQYSRMVLLQQVISASDDSTYKFDRVIVDEYCHLHGFALFHHTDLMISNVANSVIADNSC